jgi:hypothetical protein
MPNNAVVLDKDLVNDEDAPFLLPIIVVRGGGGGRGGRGIDGGGMTAAA